MTFKFTRPTPALAVSLIALAVALVPAVRAANTIFSTDIVDGEIATADLANGAVRHGKLAANAVNSGNVVNDSLTSDDLKGVSFVGNISIPSGYVANGSCRDLQLNVNGALPGESVLITVQAAIDEGVVIHGVRVNATSNVLMKVCNFTGGTFPSLSSLPIRILTFG